jgi:alkaline phosphatase
MNLAYIIFNKIFLACFILSLNFFSITVIAQQTKYTTANAHAHNDYLHPAPFYTAYNAGFGSIEADVFPVNNVLLVAHSKKEIQPQKTLKELYLIPVLKTLSTDPLCRLKLLVDIKENYKVALPLLIRELEPLKPYLSTPQIANSLTIIISGERPPPAEYKNYLDFIFFDDDLKLKHTTEEWTRVGLVSLPFYKISEWKGGDNINRKDKKQLRHIIDSIHAVGKSVRFWAAPDTQASWQLQMELHVDLIGTDKIEELANVLQRRSKKK